MCKRTISHKISCTGGPVPGTLCWGLGERRGHHITVVMTDASRSMEFFNIRNKVSVNTSPLVCKELPFVLFRWNSLRTLRRAFSTLSDAAPASGRRQSAHRTMMADPHRLVHPFTRSNCANCGWAHEPAQAIALHFHCSIAHVRTVIPGDADRDATNVRHVMFSMLTTSMQNRLCEQRGYISWPWPLDATVTSVTNWPTGSVL